GGRSGEGRARLGRARTGGGHGDRDGDRGLPQAAATLSRRAQGPLAEPGVPGGDRERVLGRDPVRGAVVAPAQARVAQAGRGGGAVRGDSDGLAARCPGDPRESELRGVKARSVVHGGAYERWEDLPAVRPPDQPARLQPRALELLPGLPALGRPTLAGPPSSRGGRGPSPAWLTVPLEKLDGRGRNHNPAC